MTWLVRAALLAVMLSMPALAHAGFADPPRHPEAYRRLQLGNRAFELARWDDAIAEYERGAMLEPVPLFWRNIALAHRSAGRSGDAARTYRTYLRRIADDASAADERARVEALVRDLEAEAAAEPVPATPGVVPAVASAPPPSQNSNVQQVQQHVTIGVATEPKAKRSRSKQIGIGFISGSVALGGLGALFTVMARAEANDANEEPDQRRQRDLRDQARNDRNGAIVAGGLAGAMLVAGVLAWWEPWASDEGSVAVKPGPGDAGVALAVEF